MRTCQVDQHNLLVQAELSKLVDKSQQMNRESEDKDWKHPVIVALAGDGGERDAVECAIRHYDYSKLHMSEFFFAECAYYALPKP